DRLAAHDRRFRHLLWGDDVHVADRVRRLPHTAAAGHVAASVSDGYARCGPILRHIRSRSAKSKNRDRTHRPEHAPRDARTRVGMEARRHAASWIGLGAAALN